MKVFYTAAYSGKKDYQKYFDLVRSVLEESNVDLVSPEKGNYKDLLNPGDIERLGTDRKIHYEAIRRGIMWADAVVIEISHEDFQLGHEATLAIQAKKHVLALSIYEDFSKKINNRYFHGAKYSELTIDGIIEEFIALAQKDMLKERFNLFLSESQTQYLDEISKKEEMNKSEYIRALIDRDRLARRTG